MRPVGRALALLAPLALAACDGIQSTTGGDGWHGERFNSLFTLFMIVTGIAYVLVLAFLAAAMLRRRGEGRDGPGESEAPDEGGVSRTLVGWIGLIALGLTILTLGSYFADRGAARAAANPALEIKVTANQWWWDVEYVGATPQATVRTANELHLPVGVPAHIILVSNDVIHSFWIPNLAGKQDMIPGRVLDATLTPSHVGEYRGQCAEYCGVQHAHMALDVKVESRSDFLRWRAAQLLPARPPTTPLQQAGYNYFMGRECSACHNITGTSANAQVAPDLTHLASRKTIAAGTLPMTRGHLYGWVADPQGPKPGNNMPYIGLEPAELHAVVAYLESLK
ncbi:MAG: cytochrome c oxidase subunit [Sphingomonadales bacterium]|jgi:cytochrome c oxidase subunit 2|nr:cytochrome c oxidase subunit [Sphingomonadales bacterium]